MIILILCIIGGLWLSKNIFNFMIFVYKTFYRKKLDLIQRYGQNTYAIITGGTDGIGKEFCFQLAQLGFNLIIISRSIEKLNKTQNDFQKLFPQRQIIIIQVDFSQYDNLIYQKIFDQIQKLDISLLVNNVGVGYYDQFEKLNINQLNDLILVNCFPITFLTYYMIPQMIKRAKKSGIINLSSLSAESPLPYFQIYAATKAYDDFISQGLSIEYGNQIDIMSLRPGYVATNLSVEKQANYQTLNTQQIVQGALSQMGYEQVSNGHWRFQLISWLNQNFVSNFLRKLILKEQIKKKV